MSDSQNSSIIRKKAAAASRRSYRNNKARVARRRILNKIARDGCVHQKTLEDPKGIYEWNNAEKAMLERCLQNRRDRYLIDPSKIDHLHTYSNRMVRYRLRMPPKSFLVCQYYTLQSIVYSENASYSARIHRRSPESGSIAPLS